MDKFEFERSRAKVKVTVAIFKKNIVIALVPSFIIQFQYNFIQVLGMTIPQTGSHFSDRVKVKVAVTIFSKKFVITLAPSFMDRL